jgi:tetrapyrrole methylase family protein/MazG family protein
LFEIKNHYDINDLQKLVARLRADDGCPWDKKQTHQSIRSNMIEEAYEAADAIDRSDTVNLREELGDVLLQVVFHCQMAREDNEFNFDEVCDGICSKLVRRHPHVFEEAVAQTPEQVLKTWDSVKLDEKSTSNFQDKNGITKALPAILKAEKAQRIAARYGYEYASIKEAAADLKSETDELITAVEKNDAENIFEEIGDVLFSAVNVSRFAHADPETSLNASAAKFMQRLEIAVNLIESGDITLDKAWKTAKETLKKQI